MGIDVHDRELLSQIQALKDEYGITSKAAFDYIRANNEHRRIRDEIVKELKREGKPFYVPTVREIARISFHFSSHNLGYLSTTLNQYYGDDDNGHDTIDARALIKEYIIEGTQTNRGKSELLTEALARHGIDIASWGGIEDDKMENESTPEEQLFLFRDMPLLCGRECRLGGAYLSAFGRGALEHTLHRLDTERRIALLSVLAYSDPNHSPSERVKDTLTHYAAHWILTKNKNNVNNLSRTSESYIRQSLLTGDELGGPDYERRREQYEYRAILENESWLERALA